MVCILLSTALIFLAGVVEAEHTGHVAYAVFNLTKTTCVPMPRTDVCPVLKTKVVIHMVNHYVESLNGYVNNTLIPLLIQFRGNESCIDAVRNLQCLEVPQCVEKDDEVRSAVNSSVALAECRKARTVCSNLIKSSFLDCDRNAENYKNQSMSFPKQTCEVIQDPTGFCPDVRYKRSKGDLDFDIFKGIKATIENLEKIASTECYEKVKAIGCSSPGACSDDEKYFVALYNQKECNETVDCLPKSNRADIKEKLCQDLGDPDDPNVKIVPYPTGGGNYTNGTVTPPYPTGGRNDTNGTVTPPTSGVTKAPSLQHNTVFSLVVIIPTIIGTKLLL